MKRNLVKAAATLYDPLGLVSPVSIIGKRLFQDTRCRGMGWDELLPQELGLQWQTWVATQPSLSRIHIPRYVHTSEDGDYHIHVFCNASERAYGAALCIRTDGKDRVRVQLVSSKNRLAPVKVTLPRLELLAALTGARLLRYYCRETGFHSQAATVWTDSMVILGWIREDPNPGEPSYATGLWKYKCALRLHNGGTALEKTIQLIIFRGASQLID
jgi:hypothetical protein